MDVTLDANGPIICRFPEDFEKIPSISFYQNYLNSQATNSPTLLEREAMCNFTTWLASALSLTSATASAFASLGSGAASSLGSSTAGAACEHLRTKELTYIENNWDNHKGNHPDRSERSEDKGSRLITRSLQGHWRSKSTHHVRHSIVDAALFQHLSRKMKETHQPGFACSAAGLFPFPFGGPFDGPLPGPFVATTGAWECIDTEDTENEYDWIWLNNNWMKLMQTESNLNLVEANRCRNGWKWTNHLQVSRGLWKDTFYQNYLNSQATNSPTLLESVAMCNSTTGHSWPLHFLWPLRRPLLFPRSVLALLLLWALLRLEQPANICEPKNWHTSKIIGTTTRETTQTGLSVPKTKAQGSLQGHYKVIDGASQHIMLDTQ